MTKVNHGVAAFIAAFAQDTQPSANAEHLKAKVTGVEGMVQVRSAEGQPWQKATVGMEVGEEGIVGEPEPGTSMIPEVRGTGTGSSRWVSAER